MATQRTSFAPLPTATVNIDVSSSSQSVALGTTRGETQVRVHNDGTATAFISHGVSGVTAAVATGMPIGPGVCEVITIRDYGAAPYIAAIAAGSTGKIYFTPGTGL